MSDWRNEIVSCTFVYTGGNSGWGQMETTHTCIDDAGEEYVVVTRRDCDENGVPIGEEFVV